MNTGFIETPTCKREIGSCHSMIKEEVASVYLQPPVVANEAKYPTEPWQAHLPIRKPPVKAGVPACNSEHRVHVTSEGLTILADSDVPPRAHS